MLSFKGQLAGAEGLSVSASDFTIEDLAIEDTVGDAQLLNIHAGNQFTSPTLNMAAYQCVVEKLPAVVLSGDLGASAG